MSDRMKPIPFDQLMLWVMTEYDRENSIFGVSKQKFHRKTNQKHLNLFLKNLESPLGPAAGPNTQLAQNIIAAYLTGSRFFELKTVQILDGEDLPVAKPCILAKDEGYNVEWSTELMVPEAQDEYIKAWFALKVLAREFNLGSDNGFIFNMSVGYDLEGIKTPKIDQFIEHLKDASQTAIWNECRGFLLGHLGMFHKIDASSIEGISPGICQSITLSTLHGCPPTEIERIATYLLKEKKLNTYVKCNPTLLGYEFARSTLDRMGYDYLAFDDHHFKNDLQYEEAIPMLQRLKACADELRLTFGVKLTNTFPVKIMNRELSGEEMYLSGRALYPLTINLAYQLAKDFGGDLRISYSGGADYYNIHRIYQAGIWPITLATTILKPGGYLRLGQLADQLEEDDQGEQYQGVNLTLLQKLAEEAVTNKKYMKDSKRSDSRKINHKVPLTDCFVAPCKYGCPIGQDIPEYIRLVGEGKYLEALKVITARNPLPFITGTLCNHRCTTKCTRLDYDESIKIREVKLVAAEKAYEELIHQLKTPEINSSFKTAIIGGGPAGLAAAYFLGKNGIDVTVFEKRQVIGGVMQQVAPDFRISGEAIRKDMELIRRMGVKFRLGVDGAFSIKALQEEGFKYIFIAIGAWKPGVLKLEQCDKEILNALEFLECFKKTPEQLKLGKNVAVIGAGNSAMDAARAAKRAPGVEKVSLVYRRTRKYMPADTEELELALAEGVTWCELLAPVSFLNGSLRCQRMMLGQADASGRRSPVAVEGEYVELEADQVIAAVGEQVETELFLQNNLELDTKGRIRVNPATNETSIQNVFVGGDALRGPATIVEGIADGTKFAGIVIEREQGEKLELETYTAFDQKKQISEVLNKKGKLGDCDRLEEENNRCLECNQVCNLCVEVCPNRANLAVVVASKELHCSNQIIHMDGMCNECGNCETFCPYASAPYQDKFTLYWSLEAFEDSNNSGFVLLNKETMHFRVRVNHVVEDITFGQDQTCKGNISKELADIIWTVYRDYSYVFNY